MVDIDDIIEIGVCDAGLIDRWGESKVPVDGVAFLGDAIGYDLVSGMSFSIPGRAV